MEVQQIPVPVRIMDPVSALPASPPSPPSTPPLASAPRPLAFWRGVIGVGLAWMMLGLVAMPAGISLNPGKAYQASLIALLYLPAWCMALTGRAATWRDLLPSWTFRLFLLLVGWAAISLAWTTSGHLGDAASRLLSVVAFVLAWPIWIGTDERRVQRVLLGAGLAMALLAGWYCLRYLWQPPADGRIVGDGVTATANYAAAVMGAAALWLSLLTPADWRVRTGRWFAVGVLLVFVALTGSRSVWLALTLCALLAPFWHPGRPAWWLAGLTLLGGILCSLWPAQALVERGASLRPQLLTESLQLIARHPWLGLGQGSDFTLIIDGIAYTHSHNVLTQTMIELGAPGLVLLVALWCAVAWRGWRARTRTTGKLVLAVWLYASVVLQFDMPQLLDSPRPGWLLVWLPLALALWLELDARRGRANAPLH